MRRLIPVVLVFSFVLAGCGGGYYKLPKDEYRERVRVLGVLPLMVDNASTVEHPSREEVLELIRRHNVGKEAQLIEILRKQKGYFDVRPIAGDSRQLFGQLVRGESMRDKGPALYRRYHFHPAAVAELADRHAVDALLVIVMNGVTRQEKRWDRRSPAYLEADYNSILVTAAVVLPSGELAWEYPAPGESFLPLQYPAFEEAFFNKTDEVRIKFITVPGLDRTLAEPDGTIFGKTSVPRLYQEVFQRMAVALRPGLINPVKSREAEAIRAR